MNEIEKLREEAFYQRIRLEEAAYYQRRAIERQSARLSKSEKSEWLTDKQAYIIAALGLAVGTCILFL